MKPVTSKKTDLLSRKSLAKSERFWQKSWVASQPNDLWGYDADACLLLLAYHILLAVDLPDAPLALVLHHLFDHLLPGVPAAFTPPMLLRGRASRHEHGPPALGVRIDLFSRHVPAPLAGADVLPPGHQLLGVLEAAGAHV